MNQERVALLDALETKAGGGPVPCEEILGAMIVPALHLARDPARGGSNFLRLLGEPARNADICFLEPVAVVDAEGRRQIAERARERIVTTMGADA